MKKALKKQAALVMLSAAIAAQTGFPGFAESSVTGNWKNENGAWKFYSPDQKAYTGWIKTANAITAEEERERKRQEKKR